MEYLKADAFGFGQAGKDRRTPPLADPIGNGNLDIPLNLIRFLHFVESSKTTPLTVKFLHDKWLIPGVPPRAATNKPSVGMTARRRTFHEQPPCIALYYFYYRRDNSTTLGLCRWKQRALKKALCVGCLGHGRDTLLSSRPAVIPSISNRLAQCLDMWCEATVKSPFLGRHLFKQTGHQPMALPSQHPKRILLTFDYELFLGTDSGTVRECIIRPVDTILDLLERYHARGVFFVDATYLLTLAKHRHNDLSPIEEQLHRIIASGSRIELHLHPHWLDAVPLGGNRWSFSSFDKFRLHALSDNQLKDIFRSGKDVLEQMIRKVRADYTVSAFRAGGWSITPFDRIGPHLLDNGIHMDFSVIPGAYLDSPPRHCYDFRAAPTDLSCWRFSSDPCKVDINGSFLEVPMTTFSISGIHLFWNRLKIRNQQNSGNGKALSRRIQRRKMLLRVITKQSRSLTIDDTSRRLLSKSLKILSKRNLSFYTMVSHPKALTDTGVANLVHLLENFKTLDLNDVKESLCALGPEDLSGK